MSLSTNATYDPVDELKKLQNISDYLVAGVSNNKLSLGGPVLSFGSTPVVFNDDGTVFSSSTNTQSDDKNMIIILATVIPSIIIMAAIGIAVYLKRKRAQISHEIVTSESYIE